MLLYNKLYEKILSNKRVIIFCICSFGAGIISIKLGQDINWDLKNYHFYNPYAFLNDRLMFDFAPAMLQTYLNPLIDMLNYWMIQNLKPIVFGFILGSIQGINIYILYLIAERTIVHIDIAFKKWMIFLACGLGFYGVANVAEIGTTFGDNIVSLFILYAVYILINHLSIRTYHETYKVNCKTLFASGLIMGVGVGLKLTVSIYPVAFVLALPWLVKTIKEYIQMSLIYLSSVFIGFTISAGYWMYILWKNFSSPLFPFFNAVFKSPYYHLINSSDPRFFPKDIFQALFYPYYFITDQRHTSEFLFKDPHLAICYTLLIFLIAFIIYRKCSRKNTGIANNVNYRFFLFFITFFSLSYFFWQKLFSIYRYLIVLEIVSPIFILLILGLLPIHKKIRAGIFILICLGTLYSIERMDWGRLPWTDSYFGVEVPKVKNLENSTIFITGDGPIAYIIPSFPKTTRFIRIQGNFFTMNIKDTTLYKQRMQKRILQQMNNSSPNYILINRLDVTDFKSIEDKIGMKIDSTACVQFQSKLDTNLCLCTFEKK